MIFKLLYTLYPIWRTRGGNVELNNIFRIGCTRCVDACTPRWLLELWLYSPIFFSTLLLDTTESYLCKWYRISVGSFACTYMCVYTCMYVCVRSSHHQALFWDGWVNLDWIELNWIAGEYCNDYDATGIWVKSRSWSDSLNVCCGEWWACMRSWLQRM